MCKIAMLMCPVSKYNLVGPTGGPLDIMARRMLCAASMELAQEIVPKISQIYPPRD